VFFFSRLKLFFESRPFARNVLKLGSGTALGQGLVVVSTPIITRLYGPEEMGLLGLFMAFVGFLTVGVGLRYEMAIVSARDDKEADHLLATALLLTLPISIFAGLIMLAMINFDILSYGSLPEWSAAAATFTLLLTGLFTALRFWFVRRSDFHGVSLALISQGCGRAIVPILLGLAQVGWLGLLLGEVVGRGLGIGRLFRVAGANIKKAVFPFDGAYYRDVLVKNWKYPAVFLPSSLLDSLVAMLPIPIVSSLFGPVAAGQFLLAQRLVSVPSGLVSASVADVFHSRLSGVYRTDPNQVRPALWDVVKKLIPISAAIYVPLGLLSPLFFGFMFGKVWADAGLLLSVLSLVSLVGLVVTPISRLLLVINRPELKFPVDFARIFIPNVALFLMHREGYNLFQTMTVFSVLSSLTYLLYFWLIWRSSSPKKLLIKKLLN